VKLSLVGPTLAICSALVFGEGASAQPSASRDWPTKPVRIIVPYAVGGSTDLLSRLVAKGLGERLGQPVIVENKPGPMGVTGAKYAAGVEPDGYTILAAPSGPMTMNQLFVADLSYSPQKDFVPLAVLGRVPFVLTVNSSSGIRTVAELIDYAKKNPATANYASSGGPFQLAGELFKQRTGTEFLHIPYKSSAESFNALLGGQVTMTFSDYPPVAPLIKSGKLTALALMNAKRSPELPDLPTIAEAGFPGVEISSWTGFVAPARTPPAIVARLQKELSELFKSPEMKTTLRSMMVEPMGDHGEAFAKIIDEDIKRWKAVADRAGIKPQ
jgi:tripartite-type tricarboxylate transporter receptor subunit TctC